MVFLSCRMPHRDRRAFFVSSFCRVQPPGRRDVCGSVSSPYPAASPAAGVREMGSAPALAAAGVGSGPVPAQWPGARPGEPAALCVDHGPGPRGSDPLAEPDHQGADLGSGPVRCPPPRPAIRLQKRSSRPAHRHLGGHQPRAARSGGAARRADRVHPVRHQPAPLDCRGDRHALLGLRRKLPGGASLPARHRRARDSLATAPAGAGEFRPPPGRTVLECRSCPTVVVVPSRHRWPTRAAGGDPAV